MATVLAWALLVDLRRRRRRRAGAGLGLASGSADWQSFDAAVLMTRWMFPYIGFMSLVALSAGMLNTWKRFAVPAATPVLLNLAMIAAGLAGRAAGSQRWGIEPIYALAAGVMVGGVLQLAVQMPALRAHRPAAAHRPAPCGDARGLARTPACARVLRA